LSPSSARAALFIPLFDELSDPRVAVDLARVAEETGWDGVFVWDHLMYRDPVERVADPWIVMSAMACATDRITIGPMVTPVPRRRPQVLARQTATLDHLSNGRLVFGVGLGGDPGGELSNFGEEMDPRLRATLLDDGLEQIDRWWRGEEAHGVSMRPGPVQLPRIPIWVASRYPHRAPVRRAARWDGWFPINVPAPDALAEQISYATEHRTADARPWDVAVQGLHDTDPDPWVDAGATWWLVRFEPFELPAAHVRAIAQAGPPTR
jgi:alkanesulfonate monooxygenase SsuD/methylene tetrahydromethanopterin reductase-like flavin-dependent oxidoreductase (luciferase family)